MNVAPVDLKITTFGNSEIIKEKELDKGNISVSKENKSPNKAILLTLSGLAAAGVVAIGISKLRKGKIEDLQSVKTVEEKSGDIGDLSEEAKRALDYVKSKLHSDNKPVLSPEIIDDNILIATSEHNSELAKLNKALRKEEKNSADVYARRNRKIKAKIRERLAQPKEPDSELGAKINNRLKSRQMSDDMRAKMQEFYIQMDKEAKIEAQKQAKRDAMLKLKEENPEEYARLKAERIKAKKLERAEKKAAELAKNTKIVEINGKKYKEITTISKNGNKLTKYYSVEDGVLHSERLYSKDAVIHTVYPDNGKTIVVHRDGISILKTFEKNEKGQYKLISREKTELYGPLGSSLTLTEHLQNETTRVTKENYREKTIIIYDKKGNVISRESISKSKPPKPPESPKAEPPKMLAPWYIEYLNLCKEFGASPRICGVPGGAWDHYYELSLKKYDPEEYASYLRIREYRARYNERAKILELLDTGHTNQLLTESEIQILETYLKSEDLSPELKALIKRIIVEAKAALARETAVRSPEHVTVHQPVIVYA